MSFSTLLLILFGAGLVVLALSLIKNYFIIEIENENKPNGKCATCIYYNCFNCFDTDKDVKNVALIEFEEDGSVVNNYFAEMRNEMKSKGLIVDWYYFSNKNKTDKLTEIAQTHPFYDTVVFWDEKIRNFTYMRKEDDSSEK